jgi:hypothetical protein
MPINPETTVRKNVALPKELWEKIRSWRFKNEINTESGAIRRLIEVGLENVPKREKPDKPERKR